MSTNRSDFLQACVDKDTEAPKGGAVLWMLLSIFMFILGCLFGWTSSAFYFVLQVMK